MKMLSPWCYIIPLESLEAMCHLLIVLSVPFAIIRDTNSIFVLQTPTFVTNKKSYAGLAQMMDEDPVL